MEKDTLKYIVDEVRSMTRDLTIYEIRPELEAHKQAKDEAIAALRKATELSEKLAAQVAELSVQVLDGNTSEKDRQIKAQCHELERLETQVERISSDLDSMTIERTMHVVRFDRLKHATSQLIEQLEARGIFPETQLIEQLKAAMSG